MSGKWSNPGVPHKGWTCVEIEDLGDRALVCQMCESQEIRFVHYMTHTDYAGELACGCHCAAKMEENPTAAPMRERRLKSRARRKKAWPNLQAWRRSEKGNLTIVKQGFRATVFETATGGYRAVVSKGDFKRFSRRTFPTEIAAQLASFEVFSDQVENSKLS
jgi:hypothetical protein